MRRILPVARKSLRSCQQTLALVNLESRDTRRACRRMGGVGIAVEELDRSFGALHEGLIDTLLHDYAAHGHAAVRESLRPRDDVGCDAKFLRRKRGAGAAEAGDDFVKYEKNAVLVADLANALQVALGRNQHPG